MNRFLEKIQNFTLSKIKNSSILRFSHPFYPYLIKMSKIFTQGKKPMKFYMEANTKRKSLQKLIESNGGKMVKTRESDSIELVPFSVGTPFSTKVSRQVFSFTFIKESLSANQLLDIKDYSMVKTSSAKSGARKFYKAEDEEKMRKYVETHAGSPFCVKFWDDALAKGLDLDHSADSLRYHWKRVMPNKSSEKKPINLPFKRIMTQTTIQATQKKPRREKVVIPDEDELKSIRVIVKNEQRDVVDFGEVNLRCEEEDVDDKFQRLVTLCSHIASRRLSCEEVLRALIARNGDTKATIDHFKSSE
jgi:hypothetical protein